MKKFLVAILAVIYLSTSIGATVHLHYCMDKLVAWSLGKEKNKKKNCPYCSMARTTKEKHCVKQTKGCCKDEQKQVKLEKDQKAIEPGFDLGKPLVQLSLHTSPADFFSKDVFSPAVEYPVTHAPPHKENISIFVRNCVFRI